METIRYMIGEEMKERQEKSEKDAWRKNHQGMSAQDLAREAREMHRR